jgi:hypothetical protein
MTPAGDEPVRGAAPAGTGPGPRGGEGGVLTERDWGLERLYTESPGYWLEHHAGVITGAVSCTRREASPYQAGQRDYAYTEAMVCTARLQEAVGALMSVMLKIGRGVPG